MRDIKVFLFVLLLVNLPLSTTYAEDNQATCDKNKQSSLTLSHALALTLENNPELKAYSIEIKAAWARELQASLRPNPELEIELEEFGGSGEASGFDSAETNIVLSQLIERGGKLEKRKRVASIDRKLADLESQSKKLEIFSETSKAFVDVLSAQEMVRLSKELLRLSQESFNAVSKRVDAGKDSPIEKTKASIILANSRISYEQSQRKLEYARKKLCTFWATDSFGFKDVSGDLENMGRLIAMEDVAEKLQLNPEYIMHVTEITKQKAILDLERSNAKSDITLGAGVKRSNETDDNTFMIGISIPLPISNRNQGAKKEAFYNLQKSREEKKAGLMKLKNEFNEAYQEYINSYNLALSLKKDVVPASAEMYDLTKEAYEEGKVDYLELLDAQRTFFEVKNEYVETLTSYHESKIELESYISSTIQTKNISESE